MLDLAGGCLLGAVLGVRHALEPDHLAAVSTLVSTAPSPKTGVLVGTFWGIGHAASLLVIWALLALLQARLPLGLMNAFELAVALMLIALGVRSLRLAIQPVRSTAAASQHPRGWSLLNRPLGAGLLHGAAGSGALTALVMAGMPSPALRLTYIVLFGLGSLLGMALLTGLFTFPLARFQGTNAVVRILPAVTGALAAMVGIHWGYAPLRWLLTAP